MTTSNILFIFYIQCLIILFSINLLQYLEDLNEKIDDIQVELNGCQDVFLSAESGHDHLGVVYDEEREQKSSSNRHSRVCHLVTHEDLQKSAQDEDHQPGGQSRAHVGEVSLSLEREGRQTDDNCSREEEGLDDNTLVEECDQNPHSVGLHHSKGSQKDQVDRSLFPLDVKSDEKTNRQEECREEEC